MQGFEHIFQPLKFGKLTAKNRIEVSPAEPMLASKEGYVTEQFIAYTAAMAKGGAAIVTIGDSPVNEEYASHARYVINLADKYTVHGLVHLVDAIHRYGALASIELNLRDEVNLPADYTKEQIKQIINDFAVSAYHCKRAGFDMIMLHGGHGHVVAAFYSPVMNKRTDEYGCDTMENRCRFANELIDAVREQIGEDMAIEYRISGDELTENGVGVEEAVAFTKNIQHKIDLIHVSAGSLYDPRTVAYMIQPTFIPMATNVHLAERFKQELDIPVVTVGSFNLPLAEEAVAAGKADMVAMIRTIIADPEAVNKAKDGRADDIRPCIRCTLCTGEGNPHAMPKPIRCSVNPIVGREPQFPAIAKAEKSKKVMIVGGGCAGLEAARWLSLKGHKPVIIEKDNELGGTLIEASANPIKSDIKRYYEWAVRSVENDPNIEIRKNTVATQELIKQENPDALIIAAGSSPIIPNIPGVDKPHVVLATDIDMGIAKAGKTVVLAGAGMTGTETAVTLAQNGHDVTVIDMLTIAEIDAKGLSSRAVVSSLRGMSVKAGVKVIEKVKLVEVTDSGAVIEKEDGSKETLPCDTLVLSLGVKPESKTAKELSGIIKDTFVVGDCNKAGNITSAVREGFYAAMNIE